MENASKALLIAGAILIAILLIGIGMLVFSGIEGITGQAGQQVDAMEIQMFNKQFEQYAGENVSGSRVKSLITAINASNATYSTDASRQITLDKPDSIGANYRYTVTFDHDISGFVNKVIIKQNVKK